MTDLLGIILIHNQDEAMAYRCLERQLDRLGQYALSCARV